MSVESAAPMKPPSELAAFWRSFKENRGAVIGLYVLVLIGVAAIFAQLIAPYDPLEQFRDATKLPPVWSEKGDWRFLLGTDALGRDMLSRLIYGARVSLFIGLMVVVAVGLAILARTLCSSSGPTLPL